MVPGYASGYGACNDNEDIATMVAGFSHDYDYYYDVFPFFKSVMDPSSPKFDPRYAVKVSLLVKHGLIPEDKIPDWMKQYL